MAVPVSPRAPAQDATSERPELNLRILQSLALWVNDTAGADALREVARAGGVSVEDLAGQSVWVSWERFERILAAAAVHTVDHDQFRTACAHRIRETYGPLLLLLKAASPQMVFGQATKGFSAISAISSAEFRIASRTRLTATYRSMKSESRLMCLSRQGQMVTLPTLWGLPKATIDEKRCIAWGDDLCEYDVRWLASRRWLPILGAVLAGAGVWLGAALVRLPSAHWFGVLAVVSLGLATYALELRKANAANIDFADDAQAALALVAAQEAEVRREFVALETRQGDWLRRVERELDGRSKEFEQLGERADGLHEKRVRVLRGQVHDLRNMLMGVSFALESIGTEPHSDAGRESLDDARLAVGKIDRILRQAMEEAEPGRVLVALEPERVEIEPLNDSLLRRLRALTHGKGLRVAVLLTREAPSSVVTDVLLMDRVLDNLLGNAAKYTNRGSVLVEVGGTPGFLTVKIADTGPGIASERIERVFRPGGSAVDERVDGFGVGLSVVVQLLAQIGGRLEVMSKPGEGTTFWVHIPLELVKVDPAHGAAAQLDEGVEQMFQRVVQIRAVN